MKHLGMIPWRLPAGGLLIALMALAANPPEAAALGASDDESGCTYEEDVRDCSNEAADDFVECIEEGSDLGGFVELVWDAGCGVGYIADTVICVVSAILCFLTLLLL